MKDTSAHSNDVINFVNLKSMISYLLTLVIISSLFLVTLSSHTNEVLTRLEMSLISLVDELAYSLSFQSYYHFR